VTAGDDVDVIEIDGASNRQIDDIRQLRQNVSIRPSRVRFKVYIIDEVHMLTKEACNALLKTLEEPPEHVKFIFATTDPQKVPITILSRCQRFDFAGVDAEDIEARLATIAASEGVDIDAEALAILASRAAGSMRDSQSLLEQLLAGCDGRIDSSHVNDLLGIAPAARLGTLVEALVARDAATALAQFDAVLADGADAGQLIDQLIGFLRDVMAAQVGCDPRQFRFALRTQFDLVQSLAGQLGLETLLAAVSILDETAARLRVSVHARTLAELALVRICHLHDLDNLADIVAGVQATGGNTTAASARPAAMRGGSAATPAVSSPTPAGRTPAPAVANNAAAQPTAAPSRSTPLTAESVATVWQNALRGIDGLIADNAALAHRVTLGSDGALELVFAPDNEFSKDICDTPANKSQIEQAIEATVGARVAVRPVVDKQLARSAAVVETAKPKSRRELNSEVVERDFVKQAMELFDVDLSRLKIIPPRSSPS
jgi:DNA polymerase-3 subunit gamma/tau